MNAFETKVANAVGLFLDRKGYSVIDTAWAAPDGAGGFDIVAEDEGVILGEDDCPCGRRGKYFKILGRLPQAEIRGCSDTYAAKF